MTLSYIRPDLYRYPSRRSGVFARNVVATSQPLAAEAGLHVLRGGGNAVDAALAAAICLTVVEPTSNGIGSDAFAIIHHGGETTGFNGSGKSPAAWTPARFAGLAAMPETGWESVTVPGAVDAWRQLSRRFGKAPFAELFEPALHYARYGYAVSPVIQRQWLRATARYGHFDAFRDTFMPGGAAPAVGENFLSPGHADSLQAIASSGGEAFYRGELAAAIEADARANDAAMTRADLASHAGFFSTPLSAAYRGVELLELPPNGQGIAALIALGILRHLDLARHEPDSAEVLHLQIEAMKLAIVGAAACVCDPGSMRTGGDELLNPERLRALAEGIDPERAAPVAGALATDRGTVYIAAADAEGTMVSFIQSNFHGFGSGIVIPGTGISMQNRGAGFSTDPAHPNCVDGGKRPFHTIIPGFLCRDGRPLGPIGVMGGHMQPQGHVQLVCRMEDFGQSLQEAIDAPRWHVDEDFGVNLEPGFGAGVARDLEARGHRIVTDHSWTLFGGAQAVLRRGDSYEGASDPRKDGCAAGY